MNKLPSQLTTALAAVLAFAVPSCAQVVLWAGRVVDSTSSRPELMVGPPDGLTATLYGSSTFSTFRGGPYPGLSTLIPYSELSRADIIAFEGNGKSPGESGGWESSHWVFSDGVTSFNVAFDATRWPHGSVSPAGIPGVVSTGSFYGPPSPYPAFFGFADDPSIRVWSYILIALPHTINKMSPAFTVKLSGGLPGEGEGTPDPDAIGILSCVSPSVTSLSAGPTVVSAQGSCPASVSFTGNIALDGPGTVLYRWERSDGGVGPIESLDFAGPDVRVVSTTWTLGPPSVSGWEAIRIISPNPRWSDAAPFSISCGK